MHRASNAAIIFVNRVDFALRRCLLNRQEILGIDIYFTVVLACILSGVERKLSSVVKVVLAYFSFLSILTQMQILLTAGPCCGFLPSVLL